MDGNKNRRKKRQAGQSDKIVTANQTHNSVPIREKNETSFSFKKITALDSVKKIIYSMIC